MSQKTSSARLVNELKPAPKHKNIVKSKHMTCMNEINNVEKFIDGEYNPLIDPLTNNSIYLYTAYSIVL